MIEELKRLAPPPTQPVACGIYELWQSVEQALSLQLPEDYKQFINTYGSGGFYDFLSIVSPFDRDNGFSENSNQLKWLAFETEQYKEMKETFGIDAPSKFPFNAYPEPEGLMAIGGIETGGNIYYLTEGAPQQWTIVIYAEDFYEFAWCKKSLTEFLVDWLSGDFNDFNPPFFFRGVLERDVAAFS